MGLRRPFLWAEVGWTAFTDASTGYLARILGPGAKSTKPSTDQGLVLLRVLEGACLAEAECNEVAPPVAGSLGLIAGDLGLGFLDLQPLSRQAQEPTRSGPWTRPSG